MKHKLKGIGISLLVGCFLFLGFVIALGIRWNAHYGKRPNDQPGSQWVSECGSISITVDEKGWGTGVMNVNGEAIDFIFVSGPASMLWLYAPDAENRLGLYPEEEYEHWSGMRWRKDRFVAEVLETTFFEEGDRISFHRISP